MKKANSANTLGNFRLCSRHFEPECFIVQKNGALKLNNGAVPTLFNQNSSNNNAESEVENSILPEQNNDDVENALRDQNADLKKIIDKMKIDRHLEQLSLCEQINDLKLSTGEKSKEIKKMQKKISYMEKRATHFKESIEEMKRTFIIPKQVTSQIDVSFNLFNLLFLD